MAGDRLRLQVPVLPDAARVLRVVTGRSSERRRHPLELEVGARPRPAARLDRSASVRRRSDRARAAVQHPLPRHAVADDDGEISEGGDRGWIAEEVRGGRECALQERRGRDAEGGRYAPAAAAAHAVRRALHRASTSAPTPTSSCRRALKATGVLVVPGGGFGESLTNGVRISFGPLVRDTAKIDEGLARLGAWMRAPPRHLTHRTHLGTV